MKKNTKSEIRQAHGSAISKEEIHRRLSAAIVDHRLPPGAKLREEELVVFFGVSRSRVREVLFMLNQERLVSLLPNRGAFVAKPSIEETRQVCETRRIIECAVIRKVASKIDNNSLSYLRTLIEKEKECWDAGERHDAVRSSREFHMALAHLAGNEVLLDILHNILSRGSLSIALYVSRGYAACLCEDHFVILNALEEGNVEQAETLMNDHLIHIERQMELSDQIDEVDISNALRNSI